MDNSRILNALKYLVTLRAIQKKDLNDKEAKKKDASIKALQKSIDAIQKYPYQIQSKEQAQAVFPGIVGKTTAFYIEQILKNQDKFTGIKELDDLPDQIKEKIVVVNMLSNIQGVGPVKAEMYFEMGIRTVEQVSEYLQSNSKPGINTRQIVGSKYFSEFQKRIPREKVMVFADNFYHELNRFNAETNHNLKFNVMGSFIRGEPTSGDIDILLFSDTDYEVSSCYEYFINKLPLLRETLSFGPDSYQGVGFIDNEFQAVRVDIKFINRKEELPYATLYFTGSGKFNEYIRSVAKTFGYTLGNTKMVDMNDNPIIAVDEGHIFHILQIPYLTPEQRV